MHEEKDTQPILSALGIDNTKHSHIVEAFTKCNQCGDAKKEIQRLIEAHYGTDQHLFAQQRDGAEFGYSLASKALEDAKKEIERLKKLVEKLWWDAKDNGGLDEAISAKPDWLAYKKLNNL